MKKKLFPHKARASFSVEFAVFSGENFIFTAFTGFLIKKETAVHGFEPLTSNKSTTSYSSVPYVTYFTHISCEFKISGFAILAVKILFTASW